MDAIYIWVLVLGLVGEPQVMRSAEGFDTKEKCEARLIVEVQKLNAAFAPAGKQVVASKCATEAEMKEQPS